jgi:hypothetical protein
MGGMSGHGEIKTVDFKEKGLISIISESSNAAFKINKLTNEEMVLVIRSKFEGNMDDSNKDIFELYFKPTR